MIKNNSIYSPWYHATDINSAKKIQDNGIDVSLSGGELGMGFYMGNFLHQAKAWAFHKNGKKNAKNSIIKFEFTPRISFEYQHIGSQRAQLAYATIKKNGNQRTHVFNLDFIYAKVLGGNCCFGFYQLKWESLNGQNFLNSLDCPNKILI